MPFAARVLGALGTRFSVRFSVQPWTGLVCFPLADVKPTRNSDTPALLYWLKANQRIVRECAELEWKAGGLRKVVRYEHTKACSLRGLDAQPLGECEGVVAVEHCKANFS